MSGTKTSRNCVVRSKSSWGPRLLLCLIAFVATGATVIWMKSHPAGQPEWHEANATIWHRWNPSNIAERPPSKEPSGLDPASVERQIVSDQNLRHALSRLGPRPPDDAEPDPWATTDETLAEVRRQLRVTSAGKSSPNRMGVSVTYLDEDPDRALKLVNTLAQGYAEQHRAKLEATIHQEYVEAQEAAELARHEYLEAQGRFDDFVAQHFLEQQALAERQIERSNEPDPTEAPPVGGPSNGAVEVPAPKPVENPERVEVERLLEDLLKQRAQLLMARTPAHPEVRFMDGQIVELEERLASIPVWTTEQPAPPPPSEGPALQAPVIESLPGSPDAREPDEPDQPVENHAETVRAYDAHKEALDRARQEYDRLSEIKRRARERELGAVRVELDLADAARPCRTPDRSPRSLLGALAAALAVALGVGMMSAGFDTDLPLATPREVKRTLRVPVVGRIPARESSPRTARRRSRRARRLAKILCGMLLVAICFGILVVVL